jgi:hypothetical protein
MPTKASTRDNALPPIHQHASTPSPTTISSATNGTLIQRAISNPDALSSQEVLQLQKSIGNQAVAQLMKGNNGVIPTNAPLQQRRRHYLQKVSKR